MWHVWGQERCTQGFSGETAEKETTGLGVDGWEDNVEIDLREMLCGV